MSLPDPAVVDAHLGQLDTDDLAALAADLWLARGFEVDRDGDCLHVRRPDTDHTVWIVGAARVRRSTPPPHPVDVVLAPRAGRVAQRVAADHDARLVDAEEFRELLWYSVDRTVWATLCERHLGAPPGSLTPPSSTRLRTAGRGTVERVTETVARLRTDPQSGVVPVLVVFVVLVVVAVTPGFPGAAEPPFSSAEGGFPAVNGGADDSLGESATATTVNAVTTTPPAATLAGADAVPGVTRDGIEDLSALVAAHNRSIARRSYTLWFDSYRQGPDRPASRVQRDVDIAVADTRYLLVTEVETNSARTRAGQVYYDGRRWYVNDPDDRNGGWRQASSSEAATIGPSPFDYRTAGLRRYLATPSTDVVGVQRSDDRTRYRLVGHGTPPGPFATQISNYTFVALVDSEGFVSQLTVEYFATTEERYQVRYEWTYGRLDETSVEAPPVDNDE